MNIGLLFFLAMSSLGVYSVVLAGWSSASKYSVIGGLRAAAQMMSYEVFMGIALTGVVLLSGSFDLNRIVDGQHGLWYVVPQFLGFIVFLLAGFAEMRRIPFDLVEAESELVAGYRTEYSGMKSGLFLVGEYLGMTLISAVIVTRLLRRLAGPRSARLSLVSHQGLHLHLLLHLGARHAAAAALRPAHGAGLEDPAAALAGQPGDHRRHHPGGAEMRTGALVSAVRR